MKVKTIKPAREVWWEFTHEATLEIDGQEFTVRINESPKWGNTFILTEDGWKNIEDIEQTEIVEQLGILLSENNINNFNEKDKVEEFNWNGWDSKTII